MSYECVIVAEKPGVARAFAKYLSGGKYRVVKIGRVTAYEFSVNGARWLSIGVSGHLMDFDFPSRYNRWSLVDPRELFFVRPIKVVRPEARKFVKALQEVGRRAKRVILATDADVEGESIAFEIMEIMRHANPNLKFSRAWFSAVTKEDLLGALRRLRELNENLANKAFTRMVLDLTIGAAFTRALTLMVEKRGSKLPRGKFLSYGPCQTPVLYLVVKRALERESFKPEKYYTLEAVLEYDGTRFKATLKQGKIKSRKEALSLRVKLSFRKEKAMEEIKKDPMMADLLSLNERIKKASSILGDPTKTAFFFVTLPLALPISVVQRFIEMVKGFNIAIGGVIVNGVLRRDVAEKGTEYMRNKYEEQKHYLEIIKERLGPLVRAVIPLYEREIIGVDMVRRVADDLASWTPEKGLLF